MVSHAKKQVFILFVSSILGLLLGILSSMINTNALPPEQYGDVRFVQNIIAFISSILLFGFFVTGSRMLAISPDETQRRSIRGGMCVILLAANIVMSMIFALLFLYEVFTDDKISALYLASIPFCGNVLMLNYINTTAQGDNHIGRIALARLLPPALYVSIAYCLYSIIQPSSVVVLLLNNVINAFCLFFIILSTKPSIRNFCSTIALIRSENHTYGKHVYWGSLANVTTSYIAGITLGIFGDSNDNVAFYTLGLTLATPLTFLPSIIGTTYFKRFALEKTINPNVLMFSLAITFVSLLGFVFCIKFVVEFVYNKHYDPVAEISAWLAVGMTLQGVGDIFNRFLGAQGKGFALRNTAFASGLFLLFGSIVFVYFAGIEGAIVTRILASLIYLIGMCYYYFTYIRTRGM